MPPPPPRSVSRSLVTADLQSKATVGSAPFRQELPPGTGTCHFVFATASLILTLQARFPLGSSLTKRLLVRWLNFDLPQHVGGPLRSPDMTVSTYCHLYLYVTFVVCSPCIYV